VGAPVSGRIRTVKPEWLEDELLAAASDEARTLSIGLLLIADDYGNGRASIATIAAKVWPYQLERDDGAHAPETLAKASRAFRELLAMRFIGTWTESGQTYFAIRNWKRHQKVDKPGKPLVPERPADLFADSRRSRESVASASVEPREGDAIVSREPRESLAPDLDLYQYQRPGPVRDRAGACARPSDELAKVDAPAPDPNDRAFGLVVSGFQSAWEARNRDAWPGAGKHRDRLDRIALEVASRADGESWIAASIAGYFASEDPFVARVRWNFATWSSDPGRWIATRSEPADVDAAAVMARVPTLPGTISDDDMRAVLTATR
jgi:hypothetical protein